MSTTSIRLPDALRHRLGRVAERAGLTAHALMLEAIAERVAAEEQRMDFQEVAEQRYGRILDSGETLPWSAMRDYLKRRLEGERVSRPTAVERGR